MILTRSICAYAIRGAFILDVGSHDREISSPELPLGNVRYWAGNLPRQSTVTGSGKGEVLLV
jgi:hypothetical protein